MKKEVVEGKLVKWEVDRNGCFLENAKVEVEAVTLNELRRVWVDDDKSDYRLLDYIFTNYIIIPRPKPAQPKEPELPKKCNYEENTDFHLRINQLITCLADVRYRVKSLQQEVEAIKQK